MKFFSNKRTVNNSSGTWWPEVLNSHRSLSLLIMCAWACHLTSLSLCFLVCGMGIITVPTEASCESSGRDTLKWLRWHVAHRRYLIMIPSWSEGNWPSAWQRWASAVTGAVAPLLSYIPNHALHGHALCKSRRLSGWSKEPTGAGVSRESSSMPSPTPSFHSAAKETHQWDTVATSPHSRAQCLLSPSSSPVCMEM